MMIKKYETFINDETRDGSANMPSYNPVIRQQEKEFVESKMKTNEITGLMKRAGINIPSGLQGREIDDFYEKSKQKLIEFFVRNPEEMTDVVNHKTYSVPAGDGVVRVQNIGGALRESKKKILEALTYSEYKKYLVYFNWDIYEKLDHFFNNFYEKDKNANRIYIPFTISEQPMIMSQEIRDYLVHNKKIILDDKYFKDEYGRKVSIPKYLNQMNQKSLLDKYEKDRSGFIKSQNCYIVISRHPYDIIGMSTDRGSTTCLNVRSEENIYGSKYINQLESLLENGTIISYLVKIDDKEIKHPISRIVIENYGDKENPSFRVDDKVYGTNLPEYKKKVQTIIAKLNADLKSR